MAAVEQAETRLGAWRGLSAGTPPLSTPPRFPLLPQLSTLTRLKVLYLHNAWHRTAALAPADWDALQPLARSLRFLSISCNRLEALPPAVLSMPQLLVRRRAGWQARQRAAAVGGGACSRASAWLPRPLASLGCLSAQPTQSDTAACTTTCQFHMSPFSTGPAH